MAEIALAPVHPLPTPKKDRTAAERQRRYRKKRKTVTRNDAVTVPTPSPPPLAGEGTPRHAVTSVTVCVTVAALGLAAISAGFSITGMTSIFVGAVLPVIGMGIALELGKLSAVAWLGRYGGSRALRAALVALVAVLMALNAVGAFGFLSKAHIGHAVAGETAVAGRAADIDARISVQTGVLADIDRRLSQIDGAIETATRKGRTGSAMALADQQRKTRTGLVDERRREAQTLAGLQVEKASLDGERRIV